MASSFVLTPEQEAKSHESMQQALWGSLISFLIINNLAIGGRLWATRTSAVTRSRLLAEDVLITLSGIFVNAIIANLMVATHFGLGLHVYTVNARDPDYPTNLAHTFRHVWITMVMMASFFLSIKMTLLFFYRRLFLMANPNPRLRIFWWGNLVFIVLWFFGATGFYLFQCQPVQWYFMRYYLRFPHDDKNNPSNLHGQCDATIVLNVSLPIIFSLISDILLLLLPLWAVSKLRVNKTKKRGLLTVFGVGAIACILELARVLALNLNTDDKDDTSYGVALFLILTGAEETTAVVCACLPIIAPRLYAKMKSRVDAKKPVIVYEGGAMKTISDTPNPRGFRRIVSVNHLWSTKASQNTNTQRSSDDRLPLTRVEISGNNHYNSENEKFLGHASRPTGAYLPSQQGSRTGYERENVPPPGVIYVQTDIETGVTGANNKKT